MTLNLLVVAALFSGANAAGFSEGAKIERDLKLKKIEESREEAGEIADSYYYTGDVIDETPIAPYYEPLQSKFADY